MTRSLAAWAIVALVVAFLVLGRGIVVAPGTQTLVCDANAPGWMLAAQPENARSGCIEILPSQMAPPDADWSIYCTMWCLRTWPEDAPDR